MNIPAPILELASEMMERYECRVVLLGKIADTTFYLLEFVGNNIPELGYPLVYQYQDEKAFELDGFEALALLDRFVED